MSNVEIRNLSISSTHERDFIRVQLSAEVMIPMGFKPESITRPQLLILIAEHIENRSAKRESV